LGYEEYLLSPVEMKQSEEPVECQAVEGLSTLQRDALEDILEDRLRGPFAPLSEGWKERVLAKASAQVSDAKT
jgi:hypothetical protein